MHDKLEAIRIPVLNFKAVRTQGIDILNKYQLLGREEEF